MCCAKLKNLDHSRENILVMAACLIACGIDPEKTILFQQSAVSVLLYADGTNILKK